MTSRHLVDRELVAMLDSFPSLELTDETVRQMRTMMKEMRSQMAANLPTFPDISGSSRFVPGPEGAPEVLVYLPTAVAAPLPALLWVHGGSVMGEPRRATSRSRWTTAWHPKPLIQGRSRMVMRRCAGCLPTLGNWASIPPASLLVARTREGTLRWIGAAHPRAWRACHWSSNS